MAAYANVERRLKKSRRTPKTGLSSRAAIEACRQCGMDSCEERQEQVSPLMELPSALERQYADDLTREARRWGRVLAEMGMQPSYRPPFHRELDCADPVGQRIEEAPDDHNPYADLYYKLSAPMSTKAMHEHVQRRMTAGRWDDLRRGDTVRVTVNVKNPADPEIILFLT